MTFSFLKKRIYKGGFKLQIDAAKEYDRVSISHFGLQVNFNP